MQPVIGQRSGGSAPLTVTPVLGDGAADAGVCDAVGGAAGRPVPPPRVPAQRLLRRVPAAPRPTAGQCHRLHGRIPVSAVYKGSATLANRLSAERSGVMFDI